ncbi:oxidoreductase domain-containing protein [Neobacillus bataviensis LMG 21833]|uniref:Oxidoreductase domain-containing protein n=1 Tax=Neobacillus bataviensis LMG 21833 TaxID=1117379 RepID=K6CYB1_9BACI|nr:Gfo/Idh/MocA family oxidoreductase [Neobacillus bataviensis]EKN65217.1 oxidoreductase domain-containing protein [Neobacillus bataviensis LMG 21833]
MEKLKVGVIGAGSLSEAHLDAYKNNPTVELVAVCDLVEERAAEKAKKYAIANIYTDYQEMLKDPELDAVSVVTWNNTHKDIAVAALDAGKHVLCEKPLCMSYEEALEIKAATERTDKQFMIGYVRRHASSIAILKEFIDNGSLGEIYYAKASNLRRLGNPGGWFSDKSRSGGGPLIDIGVHVLDLLWYLMGRPKVKTVSANTYNKLGNRSNIKTLSFYQAADYSPENNVEDLANAIIRFDNGASLMVDVSFTLHAKQDQSSAIIFGDKGGAEIDPQLVMVREENDIILNCTPQIDHPSFNFADGFQNEINHFVNSCLTGEEPIGGIEDGLEMMKILTAIYESAEKKREIAFD